MNYSIIKDEMKLDEFLNILPDNNEDEAYYLCLFGRHKYCLAFPNTKDSGQLARIAARKKDLKEKIRRLETPLGSYTRDGIIAPQEALAVYIGLNPRSYAKANKAMLITLAERFASGDTNFNPITLATTELHRATNRKFFVDFDFDDANPLCYLSEIRSHLPDDAFRILCTRGGFHVIVELSKTPKTSWWKEIAALPKCDVKGSNNLTPVPGCTQGDFTPCFLTFSPHLIVPPHLQGTHLPSAI